MLEYVFRLTFIFTTSATGTGSTQNAWRKLAKIYRELKVKKTDLASISQKLEGELLSQITYFYKANFLLFLQREDVFSSDQQLRKILRVLEIIIRKRVGSKDKLNYSDWYLQSSIDIDHIRPRSISPNAVTTNCIGNAALLEKSANRSLGKIVFSDSKKQGAYGSSQFLHTKSLVTKAGGGLGIERKILSAFSAMKNANDTEIKMRSTEIEGIFKQYLHSKV